MWFQVKNEEDSTTIGLMDLVKGNQWQAFLLMEAKVFFCFNDRITLTHGNNQYLNAKRKSEHIWYELWVIYHE